MIQIEMPIEMVQIETQKDKKGEKYEQKIQEQRDSMKSSMEM